MLSSRWHTVQDALWKAMDLVTAAREAFLAEYCEGDPELLAEVCTLLDAHEEAGDFLGGTQPSAAGSSTTEGGSRIRRLFQEVADLTPEERAAWVEAALPHEASLRREVNALLHVYERGFGAPRGEDAAPASDSLPHHTISHYRILEKLGAGGMGVVYKARDTRLDRVVALKFPRGGDGDGKARLIREARAASALDHANICTIHEIGETETGQVFIAMAYYAGETLERMLGRARLSIGDALVYAVALAQGLAKAHEQGIVHRDLKPANVMVTADGTVKLLDFGLAGVADGHVLPAGAVRATPAYMSPEQARGEPVDHRTDIWSLGVTIYEMVTGSRPFRGIDAQAVVDGILNHAPSPLTVARPEVPGPLERTVSRALAKRPHERYATVLEMLEDLREARRLSVPDGVSGQATHTEPATSRLRPGGERVHATAVVWALGGGAEGSPSGEDGPTAAPWAVACLTEVVRRHGGIVRQGRGKDIIALFGVPTPREDDCIRAARAALEVGGLLRERTAAAVPTLRVGVGIDTGSVLAREPQRAGQPHRAAGRPLRLAARLARHAGADQVLASPGSARLLERLFETEDGPPLRRVGREDSITPVRVVEEIPSRGAVDFAHSPGLSAFVGRNAEMATLLRSLRKAEAGEGQLVIVSGEAGLGKSRLLHEFRNRLGAKGVQAVQGRCSARSAYRPFQPFVGALQDWLDFPPDGRGRSPPGPVVDRIRRLAPELVTYAPLYLHLLSVPSGDHPLPKHVAGESLHRILVKALAAIFTLSARHRPLVLLLDDWQWSDPASRDVLEQMIELSPGYPLLLVVTFRPEYQPAWPQPAHQATVRLQALDEKASIRLMHSALQAEHLPQDAASSFHDRSGGNPFFLEEICRSLLDEGTLRIEGGRAIAARSLENLILPNTVQAVIRTRL
ncbi:MAG: protein kinase, partial [Gemmatimonadota bacterium]